MEQRQVRAIIEGEYAMQKGLTWWVMAGVLCSLAASAGGQSTEESNKLIGNLATQMKSVLNDRATFSSRAYKDHVRDDVAERHALEHTIDGTLAPRDTPLPLLGLHLRFYNSPTSAARNPCRSARPKIGQSRFDRITCNQRCNAFSVRKCMTRSFRLGDERTG